MDEFTGAQREMSALTNHLDELLPVVEEGERARITELLDEIAETLSSVMSHDEADRHALAKERTHPADAAGCQRRAAIAYGRPPARKDDDA